jgi:hypothetical protein
MLKINSYLNRLHVWMLKRQFQLILFNVILIVLVLLRSAGYFEPYFPITINSIFYTSLFLAIFLLGAKSKAMFIITIIFWLFTGILRIIEVNIWAERTAIYSYESLLAGVILLIYQSLRPRLRSKK